MIPTPAYRDKSIAVLGLGRTGLAAARALAASGANVRAWDDTAAGRAAAAGIPLDDLNGTVWTGTDALVLSPGIPSTYPTPHPAVARAKSARVPVISDIEIFARSRTALPRHKVAAITGTNGKSTTAALLHHLLHAGGAASALGGNIGYAALGLDILPEGGVYVLELSSYQIELTENLQADLAILLNIAPDHLDRHGGMAGYIAAKTRLFAMQAQDQIAIIGMDDADSRKIATSCRRKVVPISGQTAQKGGVYVENGRLIDDLDGQKTRLSDQQDWPALKGPHNAQNAAAAAAAARLLGLDAGAIRRGLISYQALPHRMEPVGAAHGLLFVNDSKATNLSSAAKAIAAYPKVCWIAGGIAKDTDFSLLDAVSGHIEKAYLIGRDAETFKEKLNGKAAVFMAGTLERAVSQAIADCEGKGSGVILLSPACASFDQFSDFADRGDQFRALAEKYTGANA